MKLSDWFRGLVGAKKPRIEPFNYQGPRPASSQKELTGGPKLYQEIQKRLAARVNDEAVARASQGRIAQSRGTFNRYTAPELQSYITKMGMKGSPGSGLYGKELGTQGDREQAIYSQVAGREEDRAERARSLGFGGQQTYVGNEGNLKANRALFDRAIDLTSYNQANTARANTSAQNSERQGDIIKAIAALAAPMTGGASAIPAMSGAMSGAGSPISMGGIGAGGGIGQFTPMGASYNQLPEIFRNNKRIVSAGQRGSI